MILAMITTLCGIGILIAVVCRLKKMGSHTKWSVSLAYSLLGFAAATIAVAPHIPQWDFNPHPIVVILVLAQLAVLMSMSGIWSDGPPASSQKDELGVVILD